MKKNAIDVNNPTIKTGDILHGYKVLRKEPLETIDGFYYELRHNKSGARHIHISSPDTENTFSVAFKTIPEDGTGVAHILEHTVLCGSEKFPVRDPFFFMIKRSLNTFMNAFTSSDWTMYPFSTQNKKDFNNLLDVYLDAAFFPKIDHLSFLQEGCRLELEKQSDGSETLVYKGIVYNEMLGAMSSPAQVMGRRVMAALYPTTTYGYNSGGEPEDIPSITHDHLLRFHEKYYHPSNAYFYTYGTFPLEEHLGFINDKVLRKFEASGKDYDVRREPPFEKPKVCRYTYPLSPGEETEKKSQVSVAWLTAEITDEFEVLALTLLGYILLGNASSPLRKRLIESGIGSSLCDVSGYDSDNRDTFFACGLKDVNPEDSSAIETMIFDVLQELTEKGIDETLVASAIHQLEFSRKEVSHSPYPYGLKQCMHIAGAWFHGGDALATLRADIDLDRIREEAASTSFFEDRIKSYFLDNPHRVLLILEPDTTYEEKQSAAIKQRLTALKKEMTDQELAKINADAVNLARLQESEEDLSSLPDLEISDIPPDVEIVHADEAKENPERYLYKKPTSGILYFTSVFSLPDLPAHLTPLLPFYCSAFTRLGTKERDYSEQAGLISRITGGLGMSVNARTKVKAPGSEEECLPYLMFAGKCLDRNMNGMFDIIAECLEKYDFSDHARLKSLLLEYQSALDASVVSNGHSHAISLASRHFSKAESAGELWHGVHQLQYIKELCNQITDPSEEKKALAQLSEQFNELTEKVFRRSAMKVALVGDETVVDQADKRVEGLCSLIDNAPGYAGQLDFPGNTGGTIPREGWIANSQVSFVAGIFKTVSIGHPDAAALSLISKILRSGYLHREIREKGGAYGGFALYNTENGLFGFGSYRDPHVVATLDVYKGAGEYIRSGSITEEDVKDAILQVCSMIDRPDTPAMAAKKSFFRSMNGMTDEIRKAFKATLLTLNRAKVLATAEKYFVQNTDKMAVAVISGEKKLAESNDKLRGNGLSLHKI